jgi:hypothetical protein
MIEEAEEEVKETNTNKEKEKSSTYEGLSKIQILYNRTPLCISKK